MTDSIYKHQAILYNHANINVLPIHEESKAQALKTYMWWQYDPQEKKDLDRLFYKDSLGVGILGGSPSGNMFFVDCERWDIFLELQNTTLQYIRTNKIAYDAPAVQSYRGGHIWLRAPFPVKPHSFGDWEIKAQGNYVMAPPSPHPNGGEYAFLNLCNSVPLVPSLPFITLEPKFVPKVSRFAHNLFRNRLDREYLSKSEIDQAFIVSLVRSGFEDDQIERFLRIAQFNGKYRLLVRTDPKAAKQYLSHCVKRALSLPDTEQVTESRRIVSKWERWVSSEKWTGRTGAIDRAVFLAHLYCVHFSGSLVYNASVRQLAEIAQTGTGTISNANKRLQRMDLIKLHHKTYGFDAYGYALNPDVFAIDKRDILEHAGRVGTTSITMTECPSMSYDPGSTVWERAGLGKTAQLIWSALNIPQPTQSDIAAATGRSLKTINRLLPKLLEHGLVRKEPAGYMQCDHIDWVAIARELGTQDRQVLRMWKHQTQRDNYRMRFKRDEAKEDQTVDDKSDDKG